MERKAPLLVAAAVRARAIGTRSVVGLAATPCPELFNSTCSSVLPVAVLLYESETGVGQSGMLLLLLPSSIGSGHRLLFNVVLLSSRHTQEWDTIRAPAAVKAALSAWCLLGSFLLSKLSNTRVNRGDVKNRAVASLMSPSSTEA